MFYFETIFGLFLIHLQSKNNKTIYPNLTNSITETFIPWMNV